MAYITHQDLINLHLAGGAKIEKGGAIPTATGAIVWDLIQEDEASKAHKSYIEGSEYFYVENSEISKRTKKFYTSDGEKEDKIHSNRKLKHPFLTLLVLQKIGVLLGKPITFKYDDNKDIDTFLEKFKTDWFHELLKKWATCASFKGLEWLHFRPMSKKDEQTGKVKNWLEYIIIPAEQIIAIKDNRYNENITDVIRYYTFEHHKSRGEKELLYRAEWWNGETVTYWEQIPGKKTMVKGDTEFHLAKKNDISGNEKVEQERGWGKPPFVDLLNNPFEMSDLKFMKTLVDDYDRSASDSSNDLEDQFKQLLVVKGYPGEMADPAAQGRAATNIRNNLMAFLNGEEHDGITSLSVNIQHEARDKHLERLKKDIYIAGMGVDMTDDSFGNDPSGVAITAKYGLLFLKTDLLEPGLKDSLRRLWKFEAMYHEILTGKKIEGLDKVEIVTTKTIISNEKEKIEGANTSAGLLSEETIFEAHPLVKDVDTEIKRKAADRKAADKRSEEAFKEEPVEND